MKVAFDATPPTAKTLPRSVPRDEYLPVSDQSYQHPEGCGAAEGEGGLTVGGPGERVRRRYSTVSMAIAKLDYA